MRATLSAVIFMSAMLHDGQTSPPTSVPLLDDEVLFRVPVTLYGTTNYLLVDTGTSGSALDIRFRERLGSSTRRFGGHDFYRSPEILLGGAPMGIEEVFCADLNLFRTLTGEPCDGILGMDFLIRQVMELDFDRQTVTIRKDVPLAPQKDGWSVDLKIVNKLHFALPVLINGKGPVDLQIDTGDSKALSLKQSDWDLFFPVGQDISVHRVLVAELGNKITETVLTRVSAMQVQSRSYSNVICIRSAPHVLSSAVGMQFLKRHHLILTFRIKNCTCGRVRGFMHRMNTI